MKLRILDDVRAGELGLPYELGLVACAGSVLDNVLPQVGAKLIQMGKAETLEGKGPVKPEETKPARPDETKPVKPKERK